MNPRDFQRQTGPGNNKIMSSYIFFRIKQSYRTVIFAYNNEYVANDEYNLCFKIFALM